MSAPLEALLRRRSRRAARRPAAAAPARPSTLTAAAIVISSLAALAGPWLIGIAIDNGIPPLREAGNAGPLLWIARALRGDGPRAGGAPPGRSSR